MKQNTAELWDELWKDDFVPLEKDVYDLAKEESGIRWQRMEAVILKEFGSFNNLSVIEIGAGRGINAALMAKKGAKVTILDYSDIGLERGRMFFERHGLTAEFVKHDVLSLSADLNEKYEVSMSFGLTEHFKGSKRIKMNKAHLDVLKKGGIAFIAVPHKFNPPYRIFKFIAELFGFWKVGEEYPYSRKEFKKICKEIGVKDYSFFGDSLGASFHWLNLYKIPRKIFKLKRNLNVATIKKERGSFLDQYLSYSLVLCAKKG